MAQQAFHRKNSSKQFETAEKEHPKSAKRHFIGRLIFGPTQVENAFHTWMKIEYGMNMPKQQIAIRRCYVAGNIEYIHIHFF